VLFPLVLIFSVMSFNACMSSDMNLRTVVEQAEKAANSQKSEVEAMTAALTKSIAEKPESLDSSCSVDGCTAFKSATPSSHKNSPLMDAKQPLIFVSASMPAASLKKLAYQATKHNALLVIRGMVKGSMQETAKLVDEIDHPLDIDPKLFEQFKIIKVPVFMVYHNQGWHKVSGNVDLNFALETATQQKVSSPFLKKDQS
jgi:type-F conjugative transfer system pilin assembly protein TrbC